MTSAERVKYLRQRRHAKGMKELHCWLGRLDNERLERLQQHYNEPGQAIISRALKALDDVTSNEIDPSIEEVLPCRRRGRYALNPENL